MPIFRNLGRGATALGPIFLATMILPAAAWFLPQIVQFLQACVYYVVFFFLFLLSVVLLLIAFEQFSQFGEPGDGKAWFVSLVLWGILIGVLTIAILLFRDELAKMIGLKLR